MKALRKLILGETWTLPVGVAVTLLAGLALRDAAWWPDAGGFVLLALVLATLFAALRPSRRTRPRR